MNLFIPAILHLGGAARVEVIASLARVVSKKILARHVHSVHVALNTRAVPLVRKNDAHQGRVSFLSKLDDSAEGIGA